MNVRLYHFGRSSSSWRVRIVLALKGVPYESVIVDFGVGEQKGDAFRGVNPLGQVPCLEVDGERISQSVAIAELLEERAPEPRLVPVREPERARVRRVVETINSGIQPLHNSGLDASFRKAFDASDEAILGWKRFWLERRLRALETTLASYAGTFSVADAISLADVFLYPQIERARAHGVAIEELPTVARLEQTLREQPGFEETSPERV